MPQHFDPFVFTYNGQEITLSEKPHGSSPLASLDTEFPVLSVTTTEDADILTEFGIRAIVHSRIRDPFRHPLKSFGQSERAVTRLKDATIEASRNQARAIRDSGDNRNILARRLVEGERERVIAAALGPSLIQALSGANLNINKDAYIQRLAQAQAQQLETEAATGEATTLAEAQAESTALTADATSLAQLAGIDLERQANIHDIDFRNFQAEEQFELQNAAQANLMLEQLEAIRDKYEDRAFLEIQRPLQLKLLTAQVRAANARTQASGRSNRSSGGSNELDNKIANFERYLTDLIPSMQGIGAAVARGDQTFAYDLRANLSQSVILANGYFTEITSIARGKDTPISLLDARLQPVVMPLLQDLRRVTRYNLDNMQNPDRDFDESIESMMATGQFTSVRRPPEGIGNKIDSPSFRNYNPILPTVISETPSPVQQIRNRRPFGNQAGTNRQ